MPFSLLNNHHITLFCVITNVGDSNALVGRRITKQTNIDDSSNRLTKSAKLFFSCRKWQISNKNRRLEILLFLVCSSDPDGQITHLLSIHLQSLIDTRFIHKPNISVHRICCVLELCQSLYLTFLRINDALGPILFDSTGADRNQTLSTGPYFSNSFLIVLCFVLMGMLPTNMVLCSFYYFSCSVSAGCSSMSTSSACLGYYLCFVAGASKRAVMTYSEPLFRFLKRSDNIINVYRVFQCETSHLLC